MNGSAGRRAEIGVQYASRAEGLPERAAVRAWARAALAAEGRRGARIAIRFVDAEESRALNREYRHQDAPTNVLSFAYESEPLAQGDLVVCAPVAIREAAGQGKSLEAHCAHLVVHGLLHVLGYEHESGEDDARRMEDRERAILASLGFADPYDDDENG
jgi:probable rRNA maturation factor